MENQLKNIIDYLESLNIDDKVEKINFIKKELHKISPFKNEPVDCVLWEKNNKVYANDYNPNSVAPPEMKLLYLSILEDGYTQPIVSMLDENQEREVVDGFHRHRVGKEYSDIEQRVYGYLPVVAINEERKDKGDRIAATIRHNRARGKHKVTAMSDIVVDLKKRNWSDEKIAKELGMDADEVLRLSQISGLSEMFNDAEFTKAWDLDFINQEDNLDIAQEDF